MGWCLNATILRPARPNDPNIQDTMIFGARACCVGVDGVIDIPVSSQDRDHHELFNDRLQRRLSLGTSHPPLARRGAKRRARQVCRVTR